MSQSIRVLYIEDDPSNLESISRALTRSGYSVITAQTGADGIEASETEHPDVILLDILLPDMTGFDVCEQLRSKPRLKNIPIVALTATKLDENRRMSLSVDFDGYLEKPLSRSDILNAIETLIK